MRFEFVLGSWMGLVMRNRGHYWIHCMLSDGETKLYVDTKHCSRIIDLGGERWALGYHYSKIALDDSLCMEKLPTIEHTSGHPLGI